MNTPNVIVISAGIEDEKIYVIPDPTAISPFNQKNRVMILQNSYLNVIKAFNTPNMKRRYNRRRHKRH